MFIDDDDDDGDDDDVNTSINHYFASISRDYFSISVCMNTNSTERHFCVNRIKSKVGNQ